MVIVNWEKGARGPRYTTAAANTEVIGRQLGLLLLDMTSMGIDTSRVHVIGFSLGAHVAGVASEMLKEKGYLLGRITGSNIIYMRSWYFFNKYSELLIRFL